MLVRALPHVGAQIRENPKKSRKIQKCRGKSGKIQKKHSKTKYRVNLSVAFLKKPKNQNRKTLSEPGKTKKAGKNRKNRKTPEKSEKPPNPEKPKQTGNDRFCIGNASHCCRLHPKQQKTPREKHTAQGLNLAPARSKEYYINQKPFTKMDRNNLKKPNAGNQLK